MVFPSITTNEQLTDAIIDWFEVNGADQANESTIEAAYATGKYYGPISGWTITNGVTSMSSVFDKLNGAYVGKAAATGIPTFNKNIGAWNTNGVKNMSLMFSGAALFNNGGQALAFNTSEVTSMYAMFGGGSAPLNSGKGASAFNQSLGINFNTSKVKDMSYMFDGAAAFNQSLGDKFDTSEVTSMRTMFQFAAKFNQSLGNNFTTSKVTNMGFMFNGAAAFNQSLGDKFDTSKVLTMESMFQLAVVFNQSLGNNFTTSKVKNMNFMFSQAAAFNQSLGDKFDTSQVTSMQQMFTAAAVFNQSLGDKFDTSKVTDMRAMFQDAQAFTGYGVANWQLTKRPTISTMFINSLVPTNENNTTIWYTWQDGYGYTDADLKAAGLLKRDRPNTNFAPLIGEGVSTAVTTGMNGLTEGLKKIATILLTAARGALIGVGG